MQGLCAEHAMPMLAIVHPFTRAVRLAKKLSKEPSFLLWDQSQLAEVVLDRLQQLRELPCLSRECPCGAKKPQALLGIRVDAARFF